MSVTSAPHSAIGRYRKLATDVRCVVALHRGDGAGPMPVGAGAKTEAPAEPHIIE